MALLAKPGRRALIGLLILILSLLLLARKAFIVEPDALVVRSYAMTIPDWPPALNGFRIAALGDIHGGAPYIDEKKLDEVARRISAEKADLIVWLGDYVIQGVLGGHFMEPEKVAALLSKAEAANGQIAVIGNHDRWLDAERVEKSFEKAGVTFLLWRSKTFELKGVRLHVYGLDDYELSPGYWPTLRKTIREWKALPPGEPLIVLSHSPDVFPSLPARVTLTIAAHTHGGQVRLPGIGSPIVPSSFGQRYAGGAISENGRHLFVNTGLGTSIFPIRLGVTPEISIITISSTTPH